MINLLSLLPKIYSRIKDYIAIYKSSQITFDDIEKSINDVYRNFFIQTCDIDTIKKLEKLVGLENDDTLSVEFRRNQILDIFTSSLPYTIAKLKEKLNVLCGVSNYDIKENYNEYYFEIIIKHNSIINPEILSMNLITMIPAHIAYMSKKTILVETKEGCQYVSGFSKNNINYEINSSQFGDTDYTLKNYNYNGPFVLITNKYKDID